jgi:hypothetical protein
LKILKLRYCEEVVFLKRDAPLAGEIILDNEEGLFPLSDFVLLLRGKVNISNILVPVGMGYRKVATYEVVMTDQIRIYRYILKFTDNEIEREELLISEGLATREDVAFLRTHFMAYPRGGLKKIGGGDNSIDIIADGLYSNGGRPEPVEYLGHTLLALPGKLYLVHAAKAKCQPMLDIVEFFTKHKLRRDHPSKVPEFKELDIDSEYWPDTIITR